MCDPPPSSFPVFLIIACSGLVSGPWATLADLVMVRLPMECGPTRWLFFIQLLSSNLDFPPGTIRVTSGRFPIRLYPITPVPPLPCGQTRHGLNTTTSYHGFLGNGCRVSIVPPGQQFRTANILTSSCTCPGEDHPGPSPQKGRGAPEIDVFEAERNKTGDIGGVVSQSAQFAPFTHDYLYDNSTTDMHVIYNPEISVENTYKGSAVYVTAAFLLACFS